MSMRVAFVNKLMKACIVSKSNRFSLLTQL